MIAVDTSALMAIVLGEPEGAACIETLAAQSDVVICAGTLAETLIVAARRNVGAEVAALVEDLGFSVIPLTEAGSRRVAQAYARWGRGVHPAALNFGDCFAYALAKAEDRPLLFVGEDFSRTDVRRVETGG